MSAQTALDESDRQLIVRSRTIVENMPKNLSLARIMLWAFSILGCIALLLWVGLYLKNGQDTPGLSHALVGCWVAIGFWYSRLRDLSFVGDLSKLICKLMDDQLPPVSPARDKVGP